MLFLQPIDMGRDDGGAGFNAAVIGIDRGVGGCGFRLRVIKESADIGVQRALIALEGQGVVATLFDDLLGDLPLAIERTTVTIVPLRHSIFNNLGTAVISFDLASVAICASTRR